MKQEQAKFSERLRAALRDAGIEASASVLMKRFNSRYPGNSVSPQAVSGWLNGKSMPRQDKLRALADLLGVELHYLQYGGKSRVGEVKSNWADGIAAQDRMMVDAFLHLPTPQRKLVRDLVAMLSSVVDAKT